ncbi:MAG: slipin family protein [Candidatus Aenigmatarchaeota archaeon]|jgi:regulator of protease activity HflC (stomatin/prohibitin superfamily)
MFELIFWVVVGLVLILLPMSIRVIYEYERGVVFTLGKFGGVRKPGLTFIIPLIQELRKVDMRIITQDIPSQEVVTKDNVSLLINAVVYFKVEKPEDAVIKIEDYHNAIKQLTFSALRDVVGANELDAILTNRERIAEEIKKMVDRDTEEWGIDITSIKIQEIELPAEMKRAMAKQAEAERNKRAIITISEGELVASTNLMKAAENLSKRKGGLHLRTLQTIEEIAADPSEKIVIFLPSDIEDIAKTFLKGKE